MTTDATRAKTNIQMATTMAFTIGTLATKGFAAKLSAAGTVTNCGAGDDGIGIFQESGVTGGKANVTLYGPVHKVTVGTGGATRGAYAKMAADGFTDLSLGGGTTSRAAFGIFLETGVAVDEVALMMCKFSGVSS